MAILQDMSQAELLAKIEAMQSENDRLRKAGAGKLKLKVSEKGALSVYGLGRFPVTLYRGQWTRLLDEVETIQAFIQTNSAELSEKE